MKQRNYKKILGELIIAVGILGLIGRYEIGMSIISLCLGFYIRGGR